MDIIVSKFKKSPYRFFGFAAWYFNFDCDGAVSDQRPSDDPSWNTISLAVINMYKSSGRVLKVIPDANRVHFYAAPFG